MHDAKNVLVTGAHGQLGSEIKKLSSQNKNRFYFTDQDELDITNLHNVRRYVLDNKINSIINCAAYTAVDKAESEKELADVVNHIAVKNLAIVSSEHDIELIHISTDYVFDGINYKPYTEEDEPNPQNVYGYTKLKGEKAIQEYTLKKAIIIRTSWLYSAYGNNFVKTMLRLGKERESINVVFDQIGTPTYARDLAKTILAILPRIQYVPCTIYHYSNEGVASWYDFAKEIMTLAKLSCKVYPIESSQYKTPAKRPYYSVLNKAKIKNEFGIEIPHWKESLKEMLIEYNVL